VTAALARARRVPTAPPSLIDVGIALGLSALSIVALLGGAEDAGGRDPLSVALLLAETLPLVVRRRWPIAVLVVTLGATLLHAWLADTESLSESLGALVAMFTVAEMYERRVAALAALFVAVAFAGLTISKVGLPAGLSGMIQTLLAVAGAWALGDWAQTRRRYADAVAETARLQAAAALSAADRAVQDERDRIARELHDIVSHHVSVMVIQAGAARLAIDKRPEDARTALSAIERTGRRAMTDMRRMLGVLVDAGSSSAGDPATSTLEPMPDLGRLGALVEEVQAAGLPVSLRVEGTPAAIDPGVSLSAYRIVQESLTNILKHAPGARAEVTVHWSPRAIELEITDSGGRRGVGGRAREALPGAGRGLVGMRERAALYGGTLEAGPTSTGFRVVAHLPIDDGVPA
jgi:signal transduction histidine kinase